jgi:hypothetical protein
MITISFCCISATHQPSTIAAKLAPICCKAESGDRCGYPECGAGRGHGPTNAAWAADLYSADIDFSR